MVGALFLLFAETHYRHHPYRQSVLGTAASVRGFDRDQLLETVGLVCRSVVARRTRLPEGVDRDLSGLAWRNTSLTILDGPDPWRVRLLNCSAHLEEAEPEEGGAV